MKPAVVLFSGGIDSTTTLAAAKAEGFDVNAISFDYGQRHVIELNAAKNCSAYFHVKKHLIINFDLRKIGKSALTADREVPKDRFQISEHRTEKAKKKFCTQFPLLSFLISLLRMYPREMPFFYPLHCPMLRVLVQKIFL